jgi:ribosomal protein S18 acetylase RimI-like enzyme
MAQVTQVRKARREDQAALTRTLSSAFATDPLFAWMVGEVKEPERRIAPMFHSTMKVYLTKPDHELYMSEDGNGVAVWLPIGKWKVSNADLLRSTPGVVRTFGRRTPTILKVISAMEKVHPEEPHYYLEFLGTHRTVQGKGLGSAVIGEMLERCDGEGVPAYLENSNPRNTPFYARHGFVERAFIKLPEGAPPLLAMWREPKG